MYNILWKLKQQERGGNSLGVRLPRDFVKKKNLKENMKIRVEVTTEKDIQGIDELFGSLKRKMSGQKMKNYDSFLILMHFMN